MKKNLENVKPNDNGLFDIFQKIFIISGFATIISGVIAGYYQVNYFASLIFVQNDGWCKIPEGSIGVHCFGDFNERFMQSITDPYFPAYKNNLELSPIGSFITYISEHFLTHVFTQKEVILFWVLIAISGVVLPIVILGRKNNNFYRLLFLSIFAIGSCPILYSLDRLNNMYLEVPIFILFFYTICYREDGLKKAWIFIPMMSVIKPQFAVLSLMFLVLKEYRSFIKSFISSTISVMFVVTSISGFKLSRFFEWIHASIFYSTTVSINKTGSNVWPLNLSLYNSLKTILSVIIYTFSPTAYKEWLPSIEFFSNSVSWFLIFLVLFFIFQWRKDREIELIALAFLVIIIFLPQKYVAGYYSLPLMCFAIVLCLGNKNDLFWLKKKITRVSFITAVSLTTTTAVLPFPYLNTFFYNWCRCGSYPPANSTALLWYNLIGVLVPLSWYFFVFSLQLQKKDSAGLLDRS